MHILAIATHPDDIELGCGGTILKHIGKGQQVSILDLTRGELGTRGTAEIRAEEAAAAAKILGVSARHNAELPDGFFRNEPDQLLKIVQHIRYFQPNLVLANALEDRHPDHGRGGRMIADACFISGLRKVETLWEGQVQQAWRPARVFHMIQDRMIEPSVIVDISDVQDQKMEAIMAYKSQFHNPDSEEPITYIATGAFLEQVKARSSQLGKRIGCAHGEGFICENIPGIEDFDSLLLPEIS